MVQRAQIKELEDGTKRICQGHVEEPGLIEEATTFLRKGGQGGERGPCSPRAAQVERKGGRNQLWEMGTGSRDT